MRRLRRLRFLSWELAIRSWTSSGLVCLPVTSISVLNNRESSCIECHRNEWRLIVMTVFLTSMCWRNVVAFQSSSVLRCLNGLISRWTRETTLTTLRSPFGVTSVTSSSTTQQPGRSNVSQMQLGLLTYRRVYVSRQQQQQQLNGNEIKMIIHASSLKRKISTISWK